MEKLKKSEDTFIISFDAEGSKGSVSYDGKNLNVVIADAGEGFRAGADGIMFEEINHAEQFLSGNVFLAKSQKVGESKCQ